MIKNFLKSIALIFFTFLFITPFFIFIPVYIFYYMVISPKMLFKYVSKLCKSYDQFANSALNGNIDQSLSGRFGYMILSNHKYKKIVVMICKILNKFFSQSNHCSEAIEWDRIKKEG